MSLPSDRLAGSVTRSARVAADPFSFPHDRDLDPRHTAILVIDIQVGFLALDGYFAKKGYDPRPLRAIIPNVRRVVDAGRAAGCLIVWTRQGFRADLADVDALDLFRAKRSGIDLSLGDVLVRGGPNHEIVPELEVRPGDVVIEKTANNAFYATDLDLVLRSRQVRHLIFTGCTTDVCVHSTLREAKDRKYENLLVEDACASGDPEAHRAAVRMVTIEDGIFGVVADTRSVASALEEVPHLLDRFR